MTLQNMHQLNVITKYIFSTKENELFMKWNHIKKKKKKTKQKNFMFLILIMYITQYLHM